jgi:serine/threonine protein kinase/protein involved in polysaccharide export with SLBB domain
MQGDKTMTNNTSTCDPHRIELFLQQMLNYDEQTAFELHLDDCHACRRKLETSVADDDAWCEVRDSLRDDQVPAPFSPLLSGEGQGVRVDDSGLDTTPSEASFSSQATILKLLAPTDDDRMIGRWGTYEVVGVVGSGGMGVVLKAFDAALNRYVAIKILAPHLGTGGAAIKRFFREGKAAAAVVHDNVIEIYHVAEAAGLPFLVMPYVRGPSLQRRLDDEGPLATVEVLRVGMQAAAGLAAAHAQGLVHRDVKPANILLSDGIERVKLTDFGLARAADDASLTKTGIIAGTPQYMSPEQARGEPVDPRSDLFSLGSVLYAMCTGRPPFRAETSYGVLRRITDEEPRPIREINPDIPDWLCAIAAKLMAKRPDDRFQSAREVASLLEQCLAHVQQPTVVPLPKVAGTLREPSASDSPLLPGEGQGVRAARSSHRRNNILMKGVLAMLALLGISFFAVGVVSTSPPDISGHWQGDDWGQVTLTQTAPGVYTGTYTDTVAKEKGPGKIELKWSRIERRFNGTWREGGDDRSGELSVRFADNEIRGALTTSAQSKINPATPRLADLVWTRANKERPLSATFTPEAYISRPDPPGVVAGEGIAWGTAVRGVQLGIRLDDQKKSDYRFGDLVGVWIYARNTGTQIAKYPTFTGGVWLPSVSGGSISLPGTVIVNGTRNHDENDLDPGVSRHVGGMEMLVVPRTWQGESQWRSRLHLKPGNYKLIYQDAERSSGTLSLTAVAPTGMERDDGQEKYSATGGAGRTTQFDRNHYSELDPPPKFRFRFHSAPWKNVLEWFAKQADFSLEMHEAPAGTFSFSDNRDYTFPEAIGLIDEVLATEGYVLVPRGRVLMLVNVGQLPAAGREAEKVPGTVLPSEKTKVSLPTYRIEPPDVLQIELLKPSSGTNSVTGKYLVGPDGTVNLRQFGTVPVSGKTVSEARTALEKHLSQYFKSPQVTVDVTAYNSKFYYVIIQGTEQGDSVHRLPIYGNETVLDAVAQIGGLSNVSSKKMWIVRPPANKFDKQKTLPIDWEGIAQGTKTETNYQLFPGDRLFIDTREAPEKTTEHSRALHFDQLHYATAPQSTKFTSGDFTISLWLKPDSTGRRGPTVSQYVVNRNYAYRDQRGDFVLRINRFSGDLDFCLRGGGEDEENGWIFGWDAPETRLHSPLRFDEWNHVVITCNGDTLTYAMWMNGRRVETDRSPVNISDAENTNPFTIGGATSEPGVHELFKGDLDDFRIFRRCLSDAEITELYQSKGDERFLNGEGRVRIGQLREGYWKGELFEGEKQPVPLPKLPSDNAAHSRAVQFDGRHYAKVESPPKFTTGDFTISLWFNPVRIADWSCLFMRGHCYGDQRGDIGLKLNPRSCDLDLQALTSPHIGIFGGLEPESRLHGLVCYGHWNHVVVSRCGDTYTMWMDGQRVLTEKSSANFSDADNTNPFLAGAYTKDGGLVDLYQGALDDFRIFRRCLSDKEIEDLYKSNGDETFLQGEGRVKLGPLIAGGKSERADKAEAPWGERTDGWSLRLRLNKTVWTAGESPEFTLDIRRGEATAEEKGQRDLMLNLGIIVRGGIYPMAVRLVLTDSAGKGREFEVIGPPVVNRVDDFVVHVAPGTTYSRPLPLADFWLPTTNGFRISELPPGEYRLHAVLDGKAPQHKNSDTRTDVIRIWKGTLASAQVAITVVQPPSKAENVSGTGLPPLPIANSSLTAISTGEALDRVSKAIAPVLERLNPKPPIERHGEDPSLSVSYHTRTYKIHRGAAKGVGNFSEEAYDAVGPDRDGFVLSVNVQKRGEVNQLVTPQLQHEPYWTSYIDLTRIENTDKQIFWVLSYGGRDPANIVRDIKAKLRQLQGGKEAEKAFREVEEPPIGPPPPSAKGPHARAVQFDGNHYAKIEPPSKFTSSDFTISLWFNPVRSTDWAHPFMRGFGYRDQRGDIGLKLHRDSGDLDFEAYSAGESGLQSGWIFGWGIPESRLRGPVRYAQWNHVVVTRHGDIYAMWMNGARVRTEESSADITDANNTNPLIAGGHMGENGAGATFQGALDDFRIFRRCLSDKEIEALYRCEGEETYLRGEGRVKFRPLLLLPRDNGK